MAHLAENICDTHIIPPECREQFLPLHLDAGVALRDQEVSLGGISHLSRGYEMGRRDPWFHVLIYTLRGSAVLQTSDGVTAVRGGTLLILPAHTPHRYLVEKRRWRILWFHLSLRRTWGRLLGRPWQLRTEHEGVALLAAAEGYLREASSTSEHSPRLAALFAETIAELIAREVSGEGDPHTRRLDNELWQIYRLVDSDLARRWTVRELVRMLHVSEGHLFRITMELYNATPLGKVTELRMQRAASLLRHTDEAIAAIATRVGYENAFAFSAAFHRFWNTPPSHYRRNAKA